MSGMLNCRLLEEDVKGSVDYSLGLSMDMVENKITSTMAQQAAKTSKKIRGHGLDSDRK